MIQSFLLSSVTRALKRVIPSSDRPSLELHQLRFAVFQDRVLVRLCSSSGPLHTLNLGADTERGDVALHCSAYPDLIVPPRYRGLIHGVKVERDHDPALTTVLVNVDLDHHQLCIHVEWHHDALVAFGAEVVDGERLLTTLGLFEPSCEFR